MSMSRVAGWVIAIGLACGGCMPPATLRLYEGNPLPAAKTSRVMNTERAVVRDIDGRPFTRDKHQLVVTFELRPGRHRVTVGPPLGRAGEVNIAGRTFEYVFEPGHTYSFTVAEIRGGGIDKYDVQLVDHNSGQVVARPLDARGREPGVRYD